MLIESEVGKNATVNLWVQGLDAAIERLRKTCDLGNFFDSQTGIGNLLGG